MVSDLDADAATSRRAAILDAAGRVFLRYGFKKTSMDDLARAAGLSRQGLYLHFPNKEALFKDALTRVVAETRDAGRAALEDSARPLEARLFAAFDSVHGVSVGQVDAENLAELLATAKELLGVSMASFDADVVADVARALKGTPVAAAWKGQGVSPRELAEHLYSTSVGIKHRVSTVGAYREHLRKAVQIVCRAR